MVLRKTNAKPQTLNTEIPLASEVPVLGSENITSMMVLLLLIMMIMTKMMLKKENQMMVGVRVVLLK